MKFLTQKEFVVKQKDLFSLKTPRTIDSAREADATIVDPNDLEITAELASDELSSYFSGSKTPKILITTSKKPVGVTYKFIKEFTKLIPGAEHYRRRNYDIKEICKYASLRDFTDLIVINEDAKTCNALTLVHLPHGPTAYFKLSGIVLTKEIMNHACFTSHPPELILNGFSTRIGLQVGRMLAALFPQRPDFIGRRVVTFHNQRDYIFFRNHRYIFRDEKRVGLQEIGPRFTLKLRSLQHGTFDSKFGEYEWIRRDKMDASRRKFYL